MSFSGSWGGGPPCLRGPLGQLGLPAGQGRDWGARRGRVAGARPGAGSRFQRQSSWESRRPGAERAVAWVPLGLVTHFIPVTTWARLEWRPMGRRGGQLLGRNPRPPDARPARRGPSGGCRRPWAGSVSGRGSGLGPRGVRRQASGWSDCAGSRAPGTARGLPSLNPFEAGVSVAGPGALAPGVKFTIQSAAELIFLSVFAGVEVVLLI